MKILVIGGGGREHALVWKISQSKLAAKIFCAPGNAGIHEIAQCIDIKDSDINALLNFALKEKIDLTVVGPEIPLVLGIVDEFGKKGLKIFGPSKEASRLEGSKVFTKDLLKKYKIPAAKDSIYDDIEKARNHVTLKSGPFVIKADGLAAGKGVIIANSKSEALEAIDMIMGKREFGDAGNRLVIEELLVGQEASILCFTDGKTIIPMESAQDHKRVFDNDMGPNTGGMGAYSPAPVVTSELMKQISEQILTPTIQGLKKEGITYKGVLYAGIMVTKEGPKVLEYNCRFGDPETQPLLMRMDADLLEVMLAVCEEKLDKINLKWKKESAVCVVLTSGGYPGIYKKGIEIAGLEDVSKMQDVVCFHAGTSLSNGKIITSGGRVLGVTALGPQIKSAIDKAYQAVDLIHFDGMQYRKDIGKNAVINRDNK